MLLLLGVALRFPHVPLPSPLRSFNRCPMLFPSATRKGKDMKGCLGALAFFFVLGMFVQSAAWLDTNAEMLLESVVVLAAALYGGVSAALIYFRSFKTISKKRTRSK